MNFATCNVNGWGFFKKRRQMFHYFHEKELGIIFVQESHSTRNSHKLWKSQWGGRIYYSDGNSNACGVCILISKNTPCKVHRELKDEDGRVLLLDVTMGNQKFTLCNIYAPNSDDPRFFEKVTTMIDSLENSNVIWSGDFNLVLNLDVDKWGGRCQTHSNARETVLAYIDHAELSDVWREQHPNTKQFTWHGNRPNPVKCRLDFFLVSNSLRGSVDSSVLYSSIF